MKPGIILFFLLVVLAVYFLYLKPKSSSKFGATGDKVLPIGATTIILAIKNANGGGDIGNVPVPLSFTGYTFPSGSTSASLSITYYGKNPDTTKSGTWILYSVNSIANPVYFQVLTTIPYAAYAPTTTSRTQCILPTDATKYGYSTPSAFAVDICKSVTGFSGSTDTTGQATGCPTGTLSFLCTQSTGNVTINLPAFGSTYSYSIQFYDSTNTASGAAVTGTFLTTASTATISATGLGTISIKVTPPSGGSVSIYYWIGGAQTPNTTAQGGLGAINEGAYTLGSTITIPSLTINVTVSGTASGLITAA